MNYAEDREVYVARFAGPGAEQRAQEYANWKNGIIVRSQPNWPGSPRAGAPGVANRAGGGTP